ncbi:global cell cycle regulator GcrA-like protein [Bacteroidia bacterium]|nr:global cell cycle regulator GcrA-like protein [Bacteroidia bacterium]
MANADWTPAILAKMKTYLAKGLSTAEIGAKIGMSKNAVVGKLNRLGWNAKSQSATPKPAAKKPTVTKAPLKPAKPLVKKPVKPEPKKVVAKPATKAVVEKAAKPTAKASQKDKSINLASHQRIIQHSLEMANLRPDQCRWPIGDPDSAGFHFCGEKVFAGKPYCYEHCRQAYQFTQPPKKK